MASQPKKPSSTPNLQWRTKPIEIDGVTKTAEEWCNEYGVNMNTAYKRRSGGNSWKESLTVKAAKSSQFLQYGCRMDDQGRPMIK